MNTQNELYSQLGKEVSVSQIDHELRELWAKDQARSNASLMNLVVYSEKRGGLLENSEIINKLTQENACRAILVEINRAEEASIRAWITAHCRLSHNQKSICCEQIAFHLTGRVTGRFRNTVFAHLNSDLPLVFWWQGELSDVFTERLASVMDRLIVDSSKWTDTKANFARIAETQQIGRELVLQDLAWTRCWQYRVGFAGLFDDVVAQRILGKECCIRIQHAPEHRNTALQLLAWFAVQAGWKHLENREFRNKEGFQIKAELIALESSAPLGIAELSSGDTKVRISCDKGSAHLHREIESGDYKVSALSPADPESAADLVAEQLSRGGKNSLFLKILPLFLELV